MKNNLLTLLFAGSFSLAFGQTTLSVSVNSSLDDHEEWIAGPNQSNVVGDMDAASSDLELGQESANADPQLVGMRFTNVTIPANATIVNAYIQFAVDATAKNTDPCVLTVQTEDNINPATFSDNPFSLTSRTLMPGTVTWNVSGASWATVGSAGPDQRTSDIKSLVQALVNKAGWASGNAMAFYIKGTGTREVESFDGDVPAKAPMLVVQYNTATGINEVREKLQVSAYPNPFKSSFNLSVELHAPSDVNVSVYDLTGKVVEEKSVENAGTGTFRYTSGKQLTPGMYFVKVQAGDKQQTIKIIAE
jgi:hypothetical protein